MAKKHDRKKVRALALSFPLIEGT